MTIGNETMPLNAEKQEKVASYEPGGLLRRAPGVRLLSDEPFAEGGCSGEMVRVENMGHEFFVYLKVATMN
jgi:oligogalacturonide transport system ATP-binding protein